MIALQLLGQFGNHLFEYSFLRMVGERLGLDYRVVASGAPDEWLNKKTWYIQHMISCDVKFTNKVDYSFVYKDVNNGTGYRGNRFSDQNISSIQDDTLLDGIFQGRDVVAATNPNWFTVLPPSKISPFLVEDCCFIHFRGDDYFIPKPKQAILPDAQRYYAEAKQKIVDLCGNPLTFVVVTDDIARARNYVEADHYVSNDFHSDFYWLYSAKYAIIPNSTFSWWACFLSKNRNICIAPSGWFFYEYQKRIRSDWCYTEKFTWI